MVLSINALPFIPLSQRTASSTTCCSSPVTSTSFSLGDSPLRAEAKSPAVRPTAPPVSKGPSFDPLPSSSNRWRPKRFLSESEQETTAKRLHLTGLLNKLTVENFDRITEQFSEYSLESQLPLQDIACVIFEKAVREPKFSTVYATLCQTLEGSLPAGTLPFRHHLLNLCDNELASDFVEDSKTRTLNTANFLGRMHLKGVLSNDEVVSRVDKLRRRVGEEEDELAIEVFVALLRTSGCQLDQSPTLETINTALELLKGLPTSRKLTSRIRFLIQDVVDLRTRRWQTVDDGPKTLAAIQAESGPAPPPSRKTREKRQREAKDHHHHRDNTHHHRDNHHHHRDNAHSYHPREHHKDTHRQHPDSKPRHKDSSSGGSRRAITVITRVGNGLWHITDQPPPKVLGSKPAADLTTGIFVSETGVVSEASPALDSVSPPLDHVSPALDSVSPPFDNVSPATVMSSANTPASFIIDLDSEDEGTEGKPGTAASEGDTLAVLLEKDEDVEEADAGTNCLADAIVVGYVESGEDDVADAPFCFDHADSPNSFPEPFPDFSALNAASEVITSYIVAGDADTALASLRSLDSVVVTEVLLNHLAASTLNGSEQARERLVQLLLACHRSQLVSSAELASSLEQLLKTMDSLPIVVRWLSSVLAVVMASGALSLAFLDTVLHYYVTDQQVSELIVTVLNEIRHVTNEKTLKQLYETSRKSGFDMSKYLSEDYIKENPMLLALQSDPSLTPPRSPTHDPILAPSPVRP